MESLEGGLGLPSLLGVPQRERTKRSSRGLVRRDAGLDAEDLAILANGGEAARVPQMPRKSLLAEVRLR